MTIIKILVLTVFILLSVCLLIDGIITGIAFHRAYKQKLPYTKKLGAELLMLLIWSFCLACIIVL